uniref:Uncharacterized protein n=1 Tax=Eptatretus burgeri TaxID=7764 RepID=A0A8C4Q232_EPTBU
MAVAFSSHFLLQPSVTQRLQEQFPSPQMLEALLRTLPLPPSMTCVRVAAGHTHCQAAATLQEHLCQSAAFDNARDCVTMDHPQLPDVLLVPVLGPRT